MKLRFGGLFLLLVLNACPQLPHSVTLTWDAPFDASTITSYNAYRAPGNCVPAPTFTKIASDIKALTYVDTNVSPGVTYCYVVSAVVYNAESVYSNTASATVPTLPPGNLGAVAK